MENNCLNSAKMFLVDGRLNNREQARCPGCPAGYMETVESGSED